MGEHGDNREGSELIEGHLRQSLGRDVAVFGGREASNELAEVELEVGMARPSMRGLRPSWSRRS